MSPRHRHRALSPARRARHLLSLVAFLAPLSFVPTYRGAGAAAPATLTLSPITGGCTTPVEVRGTGFPPGAMVGLTSERVSPPSEKGPQRVGTAMVGGDGRFALTLSTINGDCIELDGRTPDGTPYNVTATTTGPTPVSATATYYIGRDGTHRRFFPETGYFIQGHFLDY